MNDRSDFKLEVYASDHIVYQGPAKYLNLPIDMGQYGILARHRNLISEIVPGKMTIDLENEKLVFVVSYGLVKIENGDVLVLVETAERPEEIDINRARKAEENAKAALKNQASQREYKMLQGRLARAFAREKVKIDK